MNCEPVTGILRRAVLRHPDKPALVTPDTTLSFGQLHEYAASFAASMLERGLAPGDRVTLYAPNSADWVVAYYGSLMAGAVINPVNMLLTAEEVAHAIRDCGARWVIGTTDKLAPVASLLQDGTVHAMVCFGESAPEGMQASGPMTRRDAAGFTAHVADLDDTCAIGYTSGTTGYPKGAMHSHRAVAMNAELTAMMHGKTGSDVVVTALPLPHVYGTVVLNGTLGRGGTLVLLPRFEEATVLDAIRTHGATVFEGVPTMYYFLLNHPGLGDAELGSLRMCTVGGQSMPAAKMAQVEARFECPLVELWGMTELAGLGTTFAHTGPTRHGSIGVALPYCQARVVDLDNVNLEMPTGEPGELMFRGPLVMQGYFGNEAATRETIEADGWLHTGDVACIDEDGFIHIVDRKKDVILTAGYNIYPAELERVIAAHPDVAMVAVGGIPDEAKGELAKAYIVLREGANPTAADIVDFCREHLSAYKLPRAVAFVGRLPTTSTGKIMRRALKTLDD